MMNASTSLKDCLEIIQISTDNNTDKNDLSGAQDMAYEVGTMIWMECATEEQLKEAFGNLNNQDLQAAFIKGVLKVVSAPNNQESIIADNLRPFAEQKWDELMLRT